MPISIVCPGGRTLIDTMVAFVTVNGVVPVTPLSVAEMVVDPGEKPFDCPLLWIWATAVLDEVQLTCRVMFCVEPSE